MGREAAPQFEKEFDGLVANSTLQNYVQSVGAGLAAVSHRNQLPYEFGLLKSDIPNAFALPGGKIYITAGLFRRMHDMDLCGSALPRSVHRSSQGLRWSGQPENPSSVTPHSPQKERSGGLGLPQVAQQAKRGVFSRPLAIAPASDGRSCIGSPLPCSSSFVTDGPVRSSVLGPSPAISLSLHALDPGASP